jgi:hypothetical protein
LDEDAFRALTKPLEVEPIPPYNSGAFLVNGSVRTALVALRDVFFSFAWRLAAGASLRFDLRVPPELRSRASEWLKISGNQPIAYPSNKFWILEQIALWLTLGRIPSLSHGQFAPDDVLQGQEFVLFRSWRNWCTLAHYYNCNESQFLSAAKIDDVVAPPNGK